MTWVGYGIYENTTNDKQASHDETPTTDVTVTPSAGQAATEGDHTNPRVAAINAELDDVAEALAANLDEQRYWSDRATAAMRAIRTNSSNLDDCNSADWGFSRVPCSTAQRLVRSSQASLDGANRELLRLQVEYQDLLQRQMDLMLELQSLK